MLAKNPDRRPSVAQLMALPELRPAMLEARVRATQLMPGVTLPPLLEPTAFELDSYCGHPLLAESGGMADACNITPPGSGIKCSDVAKTGRSSSCSQECYLDALPSNEAMAAAGSLPCRRDAVACTEMHAAGIAELGRSSVCSNVEQTGATDLLRCSSGNDDDSKDGRRCSSRAPRSYNKQLASGGHVDMTVARTQGTKEPTCTVQHITYPTSAAGRQPQPGKTMHSRLPTAWVPEVRSTGSCIHPVVATHGAAERQLSAAHSHTQPKSCIRLADVGSRSTSRRNVPTSCPRPAWNAGAGTAGPAAGTLRRQRSSSGGTTMPRRAVGTDCCGVDIVAAAACQEPTPARRMSPRHPPSSHHQLMRTRQPGTDACGTAASKKESPTQRTVVRDTTQSAVASMDYKAMAVGSLSRPRTACTSSRGDSDDDNDISNGVESAVKQLQFESTSPCANNAKDASKNRYGTTHQPRDLLMVQMGVQEPPGKSKVSSCPQLLGSTAPNDSLESLSVAEDAAKEGTHQPSIRSAQPGVLNSHCSNLAISPGQQRMQLLESALLLASKLYASGCASAGVAFSIQLLVMMDDAH